MQRRICFFDVDHTITRHSTGVLFAREAMKRGIFDLRSCTVIPWYFLLYKFGSFDTGFLKQEFRALKGIPRSVYEEIAGESFERSMKEECYPEAIALIRNLKAEGNEIVLATFSLDFIVRPLARFLEADGVVASSFEFRDGVSTGRFEREPVFGLEKLQRVREYADAAGVPLLNCSFYSDSFHDLPLLESVGNPVATNPDRRLLREAKKRGWEIIVF